MFSETKPVRLSTIEFETPMELPTLIRILERNLADEVIYTTYMEGEVCRVRIQFDRTALKGIEVAISLIMSSLG